MARMWTCGFELQSATAEFGVNSGTVNGGDVVPGISTTVHRQGTASARFNLSAQTSYIEHQITSGTVVRTFHRLYVRVDTLPSTETNIYAVGQASNFPGSLRLLPNGTFVLRDSSAGTTLTGTSPAVTLGRWHRLEIDFTDVASGQSAFRGYMDGTQFADALCTNINGFSRIRIGPQVAATVDLYIDDVAINDTSGTAQTGLPGPGSVVHLRPNAAGDNNLWATAVGGTAGTANNYTRVSERTPDDATSYNQTSVSGTTTIDDFNVEDRSTAGIGASDSITLVQVGGRVASDNTTAASIVYRLKGQASGTVQESASVTVANTSWSVHAGQSPRPYQLTAYVNPQGNAAWTPSALDTIQIGVRGDVSQTTVRRVSTLWALVEFQPLTTAALTLSSETATGQVLGKAKARALGIPSETDAGQALGRRKARALGVPAETGTAQTLGRRKTLALGTAVETATAQLLGRSKARSLTAASETSTALAPGRGKARALAPAGESAAGQVLARAKRLTLPVAAETSTAQAPGRAKARDLAAAAEISTGLPLNPASGIVGAAQIGTARPLGRTKTHALGVADEVGEARPLGRARARGLPVAEETAAARPLVGTHRQALVPADETHTAQPLGWHRSQALQTAEETVEARVLVGGAAGALGVAVKEDQAQALRRRKALPLTSAGTAETARPVTGAKSAVLLPADEASTARPLAGTKKVALGTAVEMDAAQRLLIPGAIAAAAEVSTAQPLGAAKARALGWSTETTSALPLGRRATLQLPAAAEACDARPMGQRKTRAVTAAGEIAEARPLATGKSIRLGIAAETCTALIGPYVRLVPAVDRHQALVLVGQRQQPADHLTASTTGPQLTPSTSEPTLAASTDGPQLTATTTGGG